jgi:type III restriction enzyme
MSEVTMLGTVPKQFQDDAINNGTVIFTECVQSLAKLRGKPNYETNRKIVIGDLGTLLFEAPTGTGKTLMAGAIVQKISQLNNMNGLPKIIWFWFAPWSGLIEQAVRTIRTEFDFLRPKNPSQNRILSDLESGDVFVTTWSSVAIANEKNRKIRSGTETLPSIDELIQYARNSGFLIGTVIDEAHHGFRGVSQAYAFYKDVLSPDLTILATATPKDHDIDQFTKATNITNLRRITVSRNQAVTDKLIKEGVRVALFKAASDVSTFIDFKRTALKQAVLTHNKIKDELEAIGKPVVPLLLVQVDSEKDSVEQAVKWLKELGFKTEGNSKLVRTHTADEPDQFLATIAADESVEALVFKLAVATGFDAPRAFTLCSMRPSRDEDFGVQIVGRILRVDRRLQQVVNLPKFLNHGYVFLADNTAQLGLTSAALRINAVKTELASVASNVAVVTFGDGGTSIEALDKNGQINFIGIISTESTIANSEIGDTPQQTPSQNLLYENWDFPIDQSLNITPRTSTQQAKSESNFGYQLNQTLGAPAAFKRAMLSTATPDIVKDIVSRFRFDDAAINISMRSNTEVIMEAVEIFENVKERSSTIRADLAQREIDARAQQSLFKADDYSVIDFRVLHASLLTHFAKVVEDKGIETFDTPEKLRSGLHKILALRPEQLKRAISESVAQHTYLEEAEKLPSELNSYVNLDPARLNLYGVFPDDLNTWERPFAEHLDNDTSGTILWWHRNPVRKPYSVSMPLPGQPDFYPDFLAGINDRSNGKGILLLEVKRVINDQERNALVKAQASHAEYGNVMMIYWQEKREWQIVEYNPKDDKNFLDRVFRFELLSTY